MVSTTYSGPERRARPSALVADADRPVARIAWGAIFAGVVVMLALQILLNMLGLGVGIATLDPAAGDSPSAASLGTGAGIWWVASNLVAVAVGGYAASRLAGAHRSRDGLWHGLVAWCVNLLISAYLVTTVLSGLIGGAMGMVGSVAGRAADAATAAAPQAVGQIAGLDLQQQARDLLANAQGGQNGDQAASQLAGTLGQVISNPENPQIDRNATARLISEQAGISEQEANQRLDQWLTQARDAAAQARQAAEATADTVSQAAIWGFVALVLGAIAAALGGRFGADHAVSAARRSAL
ncbi:MAG TPA: PhnA-like protein [Alphaproteobacteria bacterium]|nr:PhnA-like protein [Alphaproteobacteria bacterium]